MYFQPENLDKISPDGGQKIDYLEEEKSMPEESDESKLEEISRGKGLPAANDPNRTIKLLIGICATIFLALVFFSLMKAGLNIKAPFLINPDFLSYQNVKYGFKLNYPVSWRLMDIRDLQEIYKQAVGGSPDTALTFGGAALVNPKVNPKESWLIVIAENLPDEFQNVTSKEYASSERERMKKRGYSVVEESETTLSGYPAYKTNYSSFGESMITIFAIKNGKLYSILYVAKNDIFYYDLRSVEKIFNSFEFID
jgi:hypothetical protein